DRSIVGLKATSRVFSRIGGRIEHLGRRSRRSLSARKSLIFKLSLPVVREFGDVGAWRLLVLRERLLFGPIPLEHPFGEVVDLLDRPGVEADVRVIVLEDPE